MNNILLAWLGYSDIKASQDKSAQTLGPVTEAVMTRPYMKVLLLSNHSDETNRMFEAWLTQRTQAGIKLKFVSLEDPMDFNKVYGYAKEAVVEAQKSWGKDSHLVFGLSPGTPAMAAVWIILAKTCFLQAELIVSGPRDEATGRYGIRTVSVPFEMAAEPIADILGEQDNALVRMLQRLPLEAPEFDKILRKCTVMKKVIARAQTFAGRNVPVLLLGESGGDKR